MSGRARPNDPLVSWCEASIPNVCVGRATMRHHKRGRRPVLDRETGQLVDVDAPENTMDLCGRCHDYVHGHPGESYERGWMIRRVT